MGWNDIGWNNAKIKNPNLQKLAEEGVILDRFYAQPSCTPSRVAVNTGFYPFKLGFQGYPLDVGDPASIPFDVEILPAKLKKLGYSNHLVGKWHLGYCSENMTAYERGYDSFYGINLGLGDYLAKTGLGSVVPPYLSGTVCENSILQLQCPANSHIRVTRALYGRKDGTTCPDNAMFDTNCEAVGATGIVEGLCNDMNACSVLASNSVFGDPCFGTHKSLTVEYDCFQGEKLGCFAHETRVLTGLDVPGHWIEFPEGLTPHKCVNYCKNLGFQYSGVEAGYVCFCGHKEEVDAAVLATGCDSACTGDSTLTCGGDWRLEISRVYQSAENLGCFVDASTRVLTGLDVPDHWIDFPGGLTPHKCVEYCQNLGFQYSGVEAGFACFCGHKEEVDAVLPATTGCDKACSGDSAFTCGGDWRLEIYRVNQSAGEFVSGIDFRDNTGVSQDRTTHQSILFRKRLVTIIEKHNVDNPLFLYYAAKLPHQPLQVPQEYKDLFPEIKNSARRTFITMVFMLDETIGAIVNALKEKGMWENTLFVFTSDNGGNPNNEHAGNNFPLRGSKGSYYEGGTRVPAMVHGKGIEKTCYRNQELVHITDLHNTLVKAGGGIVDTTLDSLDVWNTLATGAASPRKEIVYNLNSADFSTGAAIRIDEYKLLVGSPEINFLGDFNRTIVYPELLKADDSIELQNCGIPCVGSLDVLELYNVEVDPTESNNLVEEKPEIKNALLERINELRQLETLPVTGSSNPAAHPDNFGGIISSGWC